VKPPCTKPTTTGTTTKAPEKKEAPKAPEKKSDDAKRPFKK
jgi:hypothetical protein